MPDSFTDRASLLANELKELISCYDHRSFTAHISHLANIHVRHQRNVDLKSPIRQLMYLISLYFSTDFGGKIKYMPGDESDRKMVSLLNEIEEGYNVTKDEIIEISQEEIERIIVTKSTFLNFYLNAPLTYFEQDIERVLRTFQHFDTHILKETGLDINAYIEFFKLMTKLENEKGNNYLNNNFDNDAILESLKGEKSLKDLTDDEKIHLMDLGEQAVYEMGIPLTEIFRAIGEEKGKLLIMYFTLIREDSKEYLYYTDPCPYLNKPIFFMDSEHVVMIFSKQLINAIYEFLYHICSDPLTPGRKVSERRDLYLEDKTAELFEDFFGTEAEYFRSYYVNGDEKDLIILQDRNAYIVECKAHKYRDPLRDEYKAYNRIKDDFKKSIGKGYDQAKPVEDCFYKESPFNLYHKNKKVLTTLNPNDYDEVFTLVVTHERFGQIQCNLKYLLEIEDDSNFPWSVGVNDLESFLITLKRKRNHKEEFKQFLLAREKLQGRVFCYDELELCAYFLFDKQDFLKNCDRTEIFLSSPDMNNCFDLLYHVGFGFRDEVDLESKLNKRHNDATSFIKFHKLKPADRVAQFLKNGKQ